MAKKVSKKLNEQNKQSVRDFVHKEENISIAIKTAEIARGITGGSWFHIADLALHTRLTGTKIRNEAGVEVDSKIILEDEVAALTTKIHVLGLFGFVKSKYHRKGKLYKLTLAMLPRLKRLSVDLQKARETSALKTADELAGGIEISK